MADGAQELSFAQSPTLTPITADTATAPGPRPRSKRKLLLSLLAGAVLTAGAAGGAYWTLVGANYVSTDNAYVGAATAQINSLVAGTVTEVRINDAQAVHKDDVLVVLDRADAELALARAKAEYSRVLKRIGQYDAQGSAAAAQVQRQQALLDRTRLDYARRRDLASTGAISGEELSTSRAAVETAQAELASARETLAAQRAMGSGGVAARHPEAIAAQLAVEAAALDLSRTVIRAPVDGVVAQRRIQVGQRVQPGQGMMIVAPLAEAYVDANFKEGQLGEVRPGQPVQLTSDLYGETVVYHGRVSGLGGGAGSAFAVIPAQNATGNWIKVVQRVPVRVELDRRELAAHPLRVGLSMNARIDLRRHPS